MRKLFISLIVILGMQFCFAQNVEPKEYVKAMRYGADAMVTLNVRDVYGNPVTNAEVSIFFEMDSGSTPWKKITKQTDNSGSITAKGKTNYRIFFNVSKPNYYNSSTQYCAATRDPKRLKDGRWLPWNPTINLIFKPIMNPVHMKVHCKDVKIPQYEKPMGFDLVEFDWVEPFGKGKVSDMILNFEQIEETHPYCLIAEFPGEYNGGYLSKQDSYSILRSTYSANTNAVFKNKLTNQEGVRGPFNVLLDKSDYFVFRIRSKVDERGNFISALYGKIYGPFDYCVSSRDYVRLTTFVNLVENDTNLEFDGKGFGEGRLFGR